MLKRKALFILLIIIFSIQNVNAESLSCQSTLRRGNTGSNVKALQRKLNEKMDCSLEVDGVFGKKTYACVVRYQNKNKLTVDGIVGKQTCNSLNNNKSSNQKDEGENLTDGKYLIVIKNTNIYASQSTSSNTIKQASFGQIYSYVSNTSNWYKVKTNNGYGYIKTENIRTTFIMVDISEQRLKYMKHNQIVVDTNIVTGMLGKHDTPVGYYVIKKANRERGRTLRGYNDDGTKYAAYVNYWMPFITSRSIGFHDASWRSSSEFNNSTYTYDGSHGCVNMPSSAAKKLYYAITYDEDVIVRD
ncbi:MAG: L,D-transpeptidase family protein [Bacilli bacterium]|nr:L,D-transpeptidase family protein [Bacilli bacterium]